MLQPVCDPDLPTDPGPSLPRRLDRTEYDHTIRDLLGEDLRLAADFVPEEEALGFDNNARALQVTPLHAEQFLSAAERVGAFVGEHLDRFLPCDPDVIGDRACLEAFLRAFGRRAWRRPLDEDEVTRLAALYDVAATLDEPVLRASVELIVEALVQSPHFLYRVEMGEPVPGRPDLLRLTGYEVAARLSYLIWRSMPDEALLASAEAGTLRRAAGVTAEARRLLADPRARDGLWGFFAQWLRIEEVLRLERDPHDYPGWDDAWARRLYDQGRRFVEHAAWSLDTDLRALFDAPYTFADATLASDYGWSGVVGDAFVQTDADATLAGVVTLPAVLAVTSKPNRTSPINRGLFVRDRLLCTPLPPPPPSVVVVPPDPDPSLTTRELFAAHTADEACRGCHRLIDPIGFAFEHFDAVGRWRDVENGRPIRSDGAVTGTLDLDGQLDGAADLGRALADSEHAHRCVSLQFFRFAFGRGESEADACAIDGMYGAYVAGGYRFAGLVEQVTRSDAFRFRRALDEEAP